MDKDAFAGAAVLAEEPMQRLPRPTLSDDQATAEVHITNVVGGAAANRMEANDVVLRPTHSDDHHQGETQVPAVVGGGEANEVMQSTQFVPPAQPLSSDQPVRDHQIKAVAAVDDGQRRGDIQRVPVVIDQSLRSGHGYADTLHIGVTPVDDGRGTVATQTGRAVIDEIRALWRMRQIWVRAEVRLSNQATAYCRGYCGGDKLAGKRLADNIAKQPDAEETAEIAAAILPLIEARKHIERSRAPIDKRLEKLALSLPVWDAFAKDVRGFGAPSLAALIGETGDLSNYATPSKLWKRMGLAVMPDGTRQRRVEGIDAIEHGYKPARRAIAFNFGENIIRRGGEESPYRSLYLERRELERSKIGQGVVKSLKHAHMRAARYMTKRLLLHIWVAWRRSSCGLNSMDLMIDATQPEGEG